VTSYDDRHKIFADTTASQKLGFAAWLVENVCDLDLPLESMVELSRAHGALRRQQGVLSKLEEGQ
jgi:hypothetical protein